MGNLGKSAPESRITVVAAEDGTYEVYSIETRKLGEVDRTAYGWTTGEDGIHFRRVQDAARYLAGKYGIEVAPAPIHARPSRRKPSPPPSPPAAVEGAVVAPPSTPDTSSRKASTTIRPPVRPASSIVVRRSGGGASSGARK